MESASARLQPLLQDVQKTSEQATQTLNHLDATIGENRADIRTAITECARRATMQSLVTQLNNTMTVNSDNIDQLLDNMRDISDNLNQFTNTIKTRPSSLIRSSNPPEHKPGQRP